MFDEILRFHHSCSLRSPAVDIELALRVRPCGGGQQARPVRGPRNDGHRAWPRAWPRDGEREARIRPATAADDGG